MVAKSPTGITPQKVRAAILSEGSVSAAGRKLGISRQTVQHHVKASEGRPANISNPSRWRPGAEIVAARKAEFERVKAAAPGRAGNVIHLPDDLPFMLIILGDEHLDNPGTDLTLWEYWISFLDRAKHRTGWSMGDVLDNWLKPLAHLYSTSETPAPEGWILLEHYMEQIGEDLDCSIGGNHDDWSGHSDVLAMIMEKYGVMHRSTSLRMAYRTPTGREITVNARHGWPGHSQWNEIHGIKKAARTGIRDNILLGGHKHITGDSREIDPMTARISHCFQVAAFKRVDDYADDLGLMDRHIAPGVALVIDPRRPDTDPEMVKHFYDPAPAADYLAMLRRKRPA
jgi:hypothetical protein